MTEQHVTVHIADHVEVKRAIRLAREDSRLAFYEGMLWGVAMVLVFVNWFPLDSCVFFLAAIGLGAWRREHTARAVLRSSASSR